ncbi:MAG: hypothetical protein QOH21_2233 [Acidobacteriota bacterium]|jgi:hypothetical protein|nr:hypothetical protein [Acidobacteriota bacterium]
MSRNRWFAIAVVLLLSLNVFARDTRQELTVSLKFVPQEGVQSTSPDLLPAMLERSFELRVEDGRTAEAARSIGQGTNDDDKNFPIVAGSDVIAYVKDTLQQVATGWGLKSEPPPQRILTLRVLRFFVDESNKALGSVYAAEVKLTYVLTDGGGKKLAEGASSGSAHRYGRARSAENCSEVLSDALKEAFSDALSNTELQSVWGSGKAGSSGSTTAVAESAEDRLRKLDDLLKKGLITQAEYDKKRAEILKDM